MNLVLKYCHFLPKVANIVVRSISPHSKLILFFFIFFYSFILLPIIPFHIFKKISGLDARGVPMKLGCVSKP